MISFPPSSTVGIVIVEVKFAVLLYNFWIKVKIYCTFTAVFVLAFYYKEFLTVKLISNSFTCP